MGGAAGGATGAGGAPATGGAGPPQCAHNLDCPAGNICHAYDRTCVPRPNANSVFVTSAQYTGLLGGLAAADAICAARATAAALPGTFIAFLSTSQVNAKTRISSARGWIQTDGLPFADTVDALFLPNAHVFYPLQANEFGDPVPPGQYVLSGTNPDGTTSTNTCVDWTADGLFRGGVTGGSGYMWAYNVDASCFPLNMRLVCMQTSGAGQVAPVSPPATRRLAFITSTAHLSGGGLSAADTHCASDAATAGLPGTYKALLAVTGASALSRFNAGTAPWYRPDNVRIADSTADFAAGKLWAPISVTANGRTEITNNAVWTGAPTPLTAATADSSCTSWTSAAASSVAAVGLSSKIDKNYFDYTLADKRWTEACNFDSSHLYCLQE